VNCIIPLLRITSEKLHNQKTASRPTAEQRVKGLLGFPFSDLIRKHTIQELLDDPETEEITRNLMNKL
jgi:hypothetical protein